MKLVLCYMACFACCIVNAQQGASARISGILPASGTSIELKNISEDKWSIPTDASGSFKKELTGIKKGFYTLDGVGIIYMEPDFALDIKKGANNVMFSGTGSKENNLLRQLNLLAKNKQDSMHAGHKNFTEVNEFLKELEEYRQQVYGQLEQSKTSRWFISAVKSETDYTIRNYLKEYSYKYGVDLAKEKNYYSLLDQMGKGFDMKRLDSARKVMQIKTLSEADKKKIDSLVFLNFSFDNEELFAVSPAYRKLMEDKIQNLVYTKYRDEFMKQQRMEKIKLIIVGNEIKNPFIREYLQYRYTSLLLKMSDNMNNTDSIYNNYVALPGGDKFKAIIKDTYKNIKRFAAGSPAPGFIYQDAAGEKVSLASMKGNYVYIDVWATWCGPCKREIPYLKETEEKYRDKNIKFVSISVDEKKDTELWRTFVRDNNLQGVQLIADNAFNSEFIKNFSIVAIPRFILIDTAGKIMSANAKRPSDTELQAELKKLLVN